MLWKHSLALRCCIEGEFSSFWGCQGQLCMHVLCMYVYCACTWMGVYIQMLGNLNALSTSCSPSLTQQDGE